MLLSENMHSLTKEWALKRIDRTPAISSNIFTTFKLYKIAKILTKHKALVAAIFLLTAQFALYDFDLTEYSTTNYHGAITEKSTS